MDKELFTPIINNPLIPSGFIVPKSADKSQLHYYYKFIRKYIKESNKKEYDLLDPSTYIELELDITNNSYILDYGSLIGRTDILDAYMKAIREKGLEPKYTSLALSSALKEKHYNVADWWVNSGLKLLLNKNFMDECSAHNRIDILDWILKNIPYPKYTSNAIDDTSCNGHVEVLNWWDKSNLPLLYTRKAINMASITGKIPVLDWWNNKLNLNGDDSHCFTIDAFKTDNVDSIKWWINSGINLPEGYEYVIVRNTNKMKSWWNSQYNPNADLEETLLYVVFPLLLVGSFLLGCNLTRII